MQDVEFGDSQESTRGSEHAAALDGAGVTQPPRQSPTAERLDKELVKLRLVLQEHVGRHSVS